MHSKSAEMLGMRERHQFISSAKAWVLQLEMTRAPCSVAEPLTSMLYQEGGGQMHSLPGSGAWQHCICIVMSLLEVQSLV